MITGVNVGGISWVEGELRREGVTGAAELIRRVEERGQADARSAASLGIRCLRLFVNGQELVGSQNFWTLPFHRAGSRPLAEYSLEQKLERLDKLHAHLGALLGELGPDPQLRWETLDAYLRGMAAWNAGAPAEQAVRLLLTFVEMPPRWVLEVPSEGTCRQAGRGYRHADFWHLWIQIYIRIVRATVRHVVDLPRGGEIVQAVEIVNEPDYEWLPDEYRIERALAPQVNPLHKYVTELHLNQIPDREMSRAIQTMPWGGIGIQDGEWGTEAVAAAPLLEFPWGPKLDWYVRAFADLHTHLTWAARDELRACGSAARVISCSVTNTNLLYLAQMHRAQPETFAYVDGLGIHPYHFAGHDIWDSRFRNPEPYPDWRTATPREYARDCFKRFDFVAELGRLAADPDPQASFGMSGKEIWVTEFGIPTKALGKTNQAHAAYVPFIRRRHGEGPGAYRSKVWEDLWDEFFAQVTPDYLAELGVGAFFFYALRETAVPGYDKHDDDRSNFALLTRAGEPRMDGATFEKLLGFVAAANGGGVPR